ncbi:MAG: hypothetical protein CR967_03100 [Proteobacteria bacterium]|nr:MAG: hypothetical protein CR967_03100 [Pseudomonadota bacterium]
MLQYNNNLFSILKRPFIGEIIGFFSIFLTLGAVAGTMDYFGLRGEEKRVLFKTFLYVSLFYVFVSFAYRALIFIKKYNNKS